MSHYLSAHARSGECTQCGEKKTLVRAPSDCHEEAHTASLSLALDFGRQVGTMQREFRSHRYEGRNS